MLEIEDSNSAFPLPVEPYKIENRHEEPGDYQVKRDILVSKARTKPFKFWFFD